MPELDNAPPTSALCIDIGSLSQSAVLYRQGFAPCDMPRCVLPTAAQTLARRIRQSTTAQRDIYLCGPPMGEEFKPSLTAHVREGCRAVLAPETAETLFGGSAAAEDAGMQIADACPDGYTHLHTGDIDMAFWRELTRMLGMEMPPVLAVSAHDHGSFAPDSPEGNPMWFWRRVLRSSSSNGAGAGDFLLQACPPEMPRLHAVQSVTGGPVTLSGAAALLGVLASPEIAERSFRQGVVLVDAGSSHLTAFLVWQMRVYGVYVHHTQSLNPAQVANDLAEFRLGWLPDEEVQNMGGHGSVILELPPEAEGFAPTYITGRERTMLQGQGKMVDSFEDASLSGCFGLLHGLGMMGQ